MTYRRLPRALLRLYARPYTRLAPRPFRRRPRALFRLAPRRRRRLRRLRRLLARRLLARRLLQRRRALRRRVCRGRSGGSDEKRAGSACGHLGRRPARFERLQARALLVHLRLRRHRPLQRRPLLLRRRRRRRRASAIRCGACAQPAVEANLEAGLVGLSVRQAALRRRAEQQLEVLLALQQARLPPPQFHRLGPLRRLLGEERRVRRLELTAVLLKLDGVVTQLLLAAGIPPLRMSGRLLPLSQQALRCEQPLGRKVGGQGQWRSVVGAQSPLRPVVRSHTVGWEVVCVLGGVHRFRTFSVVCTGGTLDGTSRQGRGGGWALCACRFRPKLAREGKAADAVCSFPHRLSCKSGRA